MMPLNGKLGSSPRGSANDSADMAGKFAAKYKKSAPKDRPANPQAGNALKELAKKKAEAAMQNPKRSPGAPLRGRPAGTVNTDMGMSKPKRPAAPSGSTPGTPKRPGGTFRIS
jgi:hypothetical protein